MSFENTAVPNQLFDAEHSAAIVASSFDATPDPRLRELLTALVAHLHAFVHEVRLTPDEWERAIEFLTATGHMCTDSRQEFILLSDTLGVSMLVESLAGEGGADLTEATVEGPFHVVASPERENGASLNDADEPGDPLLVTGRVTDEAGAPVAGATVDVWHANADGFYDVQKPEAMGVGDLRAALTTDDDGRFWFRSIVPSYYPIPTDGPVGGMLRATGRHEFRPAHVHFQVTAPGLRRLTTHLFVGGSPYIDSDAVFGVKESLVFDFPWVDDAARAAEVGLPNPFRHVDFPVVLHREEPAGTGAGGTVG